MADVYDRINSELYSSDYSGLLPNVYIAFCIGGFCVVMFEVLRHVRRRRGDPKRHVKSDRKSRESWEFGYLYQARSWSRTPSPMHYRLPLIWIYQALWFPEKNMPPRIGVDQVVHVRYLRACWFFTLLHTCTTLPILMPIHINYAPDTISRTSMTRASLSSLILTPNGRRWLWVHLIILIWLLATWVLALIWVAWGALRYRRDEVRRSLESARKSIAAQNDLPNANPSISQTGPSSHPLSRPLSVQSPSSNVFYKQQVSSPSRHSLPLPPSLGFLSTSVPTTPTSSTFPPSISSLSGPSYTPEGKPILNEGIRGWRYRTVMVLNIPPDMRDEASLRAYFEDGMERYGVIRARREGEGGGDVGGGHTKLVVVEKKRKKLLGPAKRLVQDLARMSEEGTRPRMIDLETSSTKRHSRDLGVRSELATEEDEEGEDEDEGGDEPLITEVVIVRRMTELQKLRDRREDVLKKLEIAHMVLVKNVMAAVEKSRRAQRRREGNSPRRAFGMIPLPSILNGVKSSPTPADGGDLEKGKEREKVVGEGIPEGAAGAGAALGQKKGPVTIREAGVATLSKRERTAMLVKALGRFSDEGRDPMWLNGGGGDAGWTEKKGLMSWRKKDGESRGTGLPSVGHMQEGSAAEHPDEDETTIWEVLHSLPRPLLDPYQPLTHLTSLFRNQNAPLIDYLSAKLNLLTSLIDEQRARPLHEFAPSSTAFVTFRTPALARGVRKRMDSHPRRRLACDVSAAPDFRDLEWARLMRLTYRTEFVRGWVVALGVWAFTVVWIIPISLFVTLTSVSNLANIIPALAEYLKDHEKATKVVSSLVPTLLVSILTLLMPLLLFTISKKAETIVTKSELHNVLLSRYYRFLMANIVIFFCIGKTALQSFITKFQNDLLSINLITVISSSFPQAAPFYAGWLILQTSLTTGLELLMLGLPLLFYLGIRASKVPRQRQAGMEPRFWNDYYWKPVHIVTLTIIVLFAILNPLVIPFGFFYFTCAYPVFKNQTIHNYQRQYETQGRRPVIRFLRYTLDGQALAQIVFLAMMIISKRSVLIAFTVLLIVATLTIKIILTRAIKSRFSALAVEEADGLHAIVTGRPDFAIPDIEINPLPVEEDEPVALASPDDSYSSDSHTSTAGLTHAAGSPGSPNNATSRFGTWRLLSGDRFLHRWGYGEKGHERDLNAQRRKALPFDAENSSQRTTSRLGAYSSRLIAPILARIDRRFSEHDTTPPAELEEEVREAAEREEGGEGRSVANPSFVNVSASRPDERLQLIEARTSSTLLIQPHSSPSLWIDHPNDSRKFSYQPSYVEDLDTALWLPRHPLRTLDLEDTVTMTIALESSLGGEGKIGTWDTEECELLEGDADYFAKHADAENDGTDKDTNADVLMDSPTELPEVSMFPTKSPPASPQTRVTRSPTKSSLPKHPRLTGNERIELAALMMSREGSPDSDSEEDDDTLAADAPTPTQSGHLGRSRTLFAQARRATTSTRRPRRHVSISLQPSSSFGNRLVSGGTADPAVANSLLDPMTNSVASPAGLSPHAGPSTAVSGTFQGGGTGMSETGGRPSAPGRGRSNSGAVTARAAVLEEVMAEERAAAMRDRKEEADRTEMEGSRLKRGGSRMLKSLVHH